MHSGHRLRGLALAYAAALWAALAVASPPNVGAQRPPEPAPPASARPSTRPAVEPPELSGLRAAFLSGAPDDVARAGQRLSSRRLIDALTGRDRELALAAAAAAPAATDCVWLLAALGRLARSPDRPLAAAAARAAAHIAGALDLDSLLQLDVPLDWVRARLAEYRALAADAGRWPDIRVASLEVSAALARALGERATPADAPYDLRAVLADPDPEVRRAAVELAAGPLQPDAIAVIAARVAGDDDRAVAAAAAQTLCEGLDFGDPAQPVLAALGERGLARVRAIVADADQPLSVRAAAGRCLAADGSPASRAARRQLGAPDRSRPTSAGEEAK